MNELASLLHNALALLRGALVALALQLELDPLARLHIPLALKALALQVHELAQE